MSSVAPSAPNEIPRNFAAGQLPTLPMKEFSRQFAATIPGLIRFVLSQELQAHPKWGKLLPYDVTNYGKLASPGHICRPDIVWTSAGDDQLLPRVTEIDFVPSGRGWLLASLDHSDQVAVCQAFARWYRHMGTQKVYYGTGTVTVCKPEAEYFAAKMRSLAEFNLQSVNVDSYPLPDNAFLDRLFYAYESTGFDPRDMRIATAEPVLDSKMVFAMVHDPAMYDMLVVALGRENTDFLKEVLIPSYLVADVRDDPGQFGLDLYEDVIGTTQAGGNCRGNWVIKSTEVEASFSWGARSVVLGGHYGRTVWENAVLHGASPKRKDIGSNPVLQPFMLSADFTQWWNATLDGGLASANPAQFGGSSDPVTFRQAKKLVTARLGLYFLVSHAGEGKVICPEVGLATLRQDPIAHGAADAKIHAFRATDPLPQAA